MIGPLLASCISAAAAASGVPQDALYALRWQEHGEIGTVHRNENGTRDLGPFQINTVHLDHFTRAWQTGSVATTYALLRDDPCANAFAAAELLKDGLAATAGNLTRALGLYHSATPAYAVPYRQAVVALLSKLR